MRRGKPRTLTPEQRRANNVKRVQRCKDRKRRNVAPYIIEIGEHVFDILEKYDGLGMAKADDKQAVQAALQRVLALALAALVQVDPR
jgi:hypothetical protein